LGAEIFCTRSYRSWGPPSLLCNGYRVFSEDKVDGTGHGVDHPSLSSAEVKERIVLYLYSTSGTSYPVTE